MNEFPKSYTLDELFEEGDREMREHLANGWGQWRYDPEVLVLIFTMDDQRDHHYEVDLERCKTSAQVLDWIMQVAGKNWATPQVMYDLIRAIDDLLHLQSNYCSWGEERNPDVYEVLKKNTAV
jgi:hypothetical protein